jgi:chemotaxis protein methyltransferase WspC
MNAHHDNAPLYRRFAELLHRTIGLDAASLGHSAIERAVDQRVAAWCADGHAEATLADYWEAAQCSPSMLQALIETVVVPETWFYRDTDAFKALARLAHARLAERGNALPLRVLSLPCSTGEEPYTIAMTLLDSGIDAAQLRNALSTDAIRFAAMRFRFATRTSRAPKTAGVSRRASSTQCVFRAPI